MNTAAITAQMRILIEQLKQHNHAYYVLDNPLLEDSETTNFAKNWWH